MSDFIEDRPELMAMLNAAPRTLHDERVMPWRPMAVASKDRTPILLKFVDKLEYEGRPDLARWNGLMIVGRHPGLADDGFDTGWNFAAPVGMGGFPDEWFEGWRSLAIVADPYTAEVERLTELLAEAEQALILTLQEVDAWRSGLNTRVGMRNLNKAKVGCCWVFDLKFIRDLLFRISSGGGGS